MPYVGALLIDAVAAFCGEIPKRWLTAAVPASVGGRYQHSEVEQPMRAMVVDDSRAMRMLLRRNLSAIGCEVSEAGGGLDALSSLNSQPQLPSLLLVDWNMPEMTGLELVKKVRCEPRYAAIRVLMVTTETELDQMASALEAGADEYLMKPFTKEALADKLRLLGILQ
jgi:two-component system chemotaxis response regulator CheY